MSRRIARMLLVLLVVFPLIGPGETNAAAAPIFAWGYNAFGQLGNGTRGVAAGSNTPVTVAGLGNIVTVAAGGEHSLALRGDGTVVAWGWNTFGQLGDGTYTGRDTPVAVVGLSGIVGIAAGGEHSLALRGDGTVVAWGSTQFGQLGGNQPANPLTGPNSPVAVTGLTSIVAIAAGGFHSLALGRDGTVFAWGHNFLGQLGDGTLDDRPTPAAVPGVVGAVGIAAGGYSSFARGEDGTVIAWGENVYGEMGIGTSSRSERPRTIPGLASVVAIAGGQYHVVAATGTLPPFFADVPVGYWAHDQIGALARRGTTAGCGDNTLGQRLYCPERSVTRAEMAVFIVRTLGFVAPPTPTKQTFADVPPGYWAYALIEQFAALGITAGCGTGEFCPDRGVTRAEMATFLVRALERDQRADATPTFVDVPAGHPQFGYVEALASLGVTTGRGTDDAGRRLYCPERGVTRAEMAVLIVQAFP